MYWRMLLKANAKEIKQVFVNIIKKEIYCRSPELIWATAKICIIDFQAIRI